MHFETASTTIQWISVLIIDHCKHKPCLLNDYFDVGKQKRDKMDYRKIISFFPQPTKYINWVLPMQLITHYFFI